MFVKRIELRNFRCFSRKLITFDNPIVLIEGANGSGKSSLLEAIHYACYLRSFRTYTASELLKFDQEAFFINVEFNQIDNDDPQLSHILQVGSSGTDRSVKLDNHVLQSYKDLMDVFRVITLSEDDMGLIKEGPEIRRNFIDQALVLYAQDYIKLLREYKVILANRNKLLQMERLDQTSNHVWGEQLWSKSQLIQAHRKQFLEMLQQEVTLMVKEQFPFNVDINFSYQSKTELTSSWLEFMKIHQENGLFEKEKNLRRSLFGSHLDEIVVRFQNASSRYYASRGQQKLVVLLIKIAQLRILDRLKGSAVFLLDDFMTDFDNTYLEIALKGLFGTVKSQMIFTVPSKNSSLSDSFKRAGAQILQFQSE